MLSVVPEILPVAVSKRGELLLTGRKAISDGDMNVLKLLKKLRTKQS
jgi:hypothetical protein